MSRHQQAVTTPTFLASPFQSVTLHTGLAFGRLVSPFQRHPSKGAASCCGAVSRHATAMHPPGFRHAPTAKPPPNATPGPDIPSIMDSQEGSYLVVNQLPKESQFATFPQDASTIEDGPDHEPGLQQLQKRRASMGNDVSGIITSIAGNARIQRRASAVSIAPGFDAGTKDESGREQAGSSAFGTKRFRQNKMNPISSSFAPTPQRSLRRYLTRDVLPHMDNYRHRMSFVKGKRIFVHRCRCLNCCSLTLKTISSICNLSSLYYRHQKETTTYH